jgi:hypothetical protein
MTMRQAVPTGKNPKLAHLGDKNALSIGSSIAEALPVVLWTWFVDQCWFSYNFI